MFEGVKPVEALNNTRQAVADAAGKLLATLGSDPDRLLNTASRALYVSGAVLGAALGTVIARLPETSKIIDPITDLTKSGEGEKSLAIVSIGENREGQPARYRIGDTDIEIATSPKPIIGDGPKQLKDEEKQLLALGVYGILRDAAFQNDAVMLKKGDGVQVTINPPTDNGCDSVSLRYTLISRSQTGGNASHVTDFNLFCSEKPSNVIRSTFAGFQRQLQAS